MPAPIRSTPATAPARDGTVALTIVGGNDSSDAADQIFAGSASDIIFGNGGNDTISAGNGANTVFGGFGNDSILTGTGADTIWGNEGNDSMTGGAGADRYVFLTGSGDDQINGFAFSEGDRLDLQGQTFTQGTAGDGSVRLTLSGGGTIALVGVTTFDAGSVV
jgi:Ca2+-binding RTX toxin-like protein